MENHFKLCTFVGIVITALIPASDLTCVDDRNATLRTNYFDPLVDALNFISPPPPPIQEFFCDNVTYKGYIEGIITEFKSCPDFVNETSMLDELKHDASGFHAAELFYVDSADLFCECSRNISCLDSMNDTAMVVQHVDNRAWSKMPDPDYICGAGKTDLECLGTLLPQCETYFNFKLNHSDGENFTVAHFEYGDIYASKYCGAQKDNYTSYTCVNDRASLYSLMSCVKMANLYKSEADRSCGLRRCIDINMETCPPEQIEYFVDAVNVFSMNRVSTESCPAKASIPVLSVSSILLLGFIIFAGF